MTRALYYPPADRSQWYGPGNATVAPTKVLWHTTETPGGWPAYGGGSMAPNLTYDPWAHKWRQHFPLNGTARALKNGSGYSTNRVGVCQVEVSCYCDPARFGSGRGVDRLDGQAYDDMRRFGEFMAAEWGVPMTVGVTVKPYPASYGPNNGVRMSPGAFAAYRGHCAHMHAPYGDHGDSGGLDLARIVATPNPTPPDTEEYDMAKPKKIRMIAKDGGQYMALVTVEGRVIGLTGSPVAGGQTAHSDDALADRYIDLVTRPDDVLIYADQAHDIDLLLARQS